MLLRSSSGPGSGNGPALPELHRRLKWVALAIIIAIGFLVGRLWQLQVMRGESYYERTVSNVVKERYLPSVRGKILDKTPSRSRPEMGSFRTETTVTNQDGVPVMRFTSIVLIARRPEGQPA